jgi:hypothetical protein
VPSVGAGAVTWQLAVAVLAAAVFLYNFSIAVYFILIPLSPGSVFAGSSGSRLYGQLVVHLALAGVAAGGVLAAMRDPKTTLTILLGGVTLRAAVRVVAMLLHVQLMWMLAEWLLIGAGAGAVLWSRWMKTPREAGDSSRLANALTVLIGAQIGTMLYGMAIVPSYALTLDMLAALAVTGGVVFLRLQLPAALGPA